MSNTTWNLVKNQEAYFKKIYKLLFIIGTSELTPSINLSNHFA